MANLQHATQVKPDPVRSIAFFGSKSATFGPLRCVKVEAIGIGTAKACLDQRGVLVTEKGSSDWPEITLLKYRSGVNDSAFRLNGTSTSFGHNFAATPS
jgi:hypothetical protein